MLTQNYQRYREIYWNMFHFNKLSTIANIVEGLFLFKYTPMDFVAGVDGYIL